jgi:hypothetical protein
MNPLELSPEHFRALAADVIALSAEYLSTLDSRSVFPRTNGAETERLFGEEVPEHGMGDRAFDALSPHLSQLGRRGTKFVRIGSCEKVSQGAVVWLIRFSLGARVFLSPRLFRRAPYQRLTEAREKLFGILLFQYFSGTAHSFS